MIAGGELLAGIAAPALAGIGLGLAARCPTPGASAWAGAALALSAAIGHAALANVQGDVLMPPRNGYQWSAWYAVAVGGILLVPARIIPRLGLLALAAAVFWFLSIRPLHPHALSTGMALAMGSGLLATGLALGGLLETALRTWPTTSSLLAGTAALATAAMAAALAGSLVLGQLAGTAAAACGGLTAAWLWSRKPPAGAGWAVGALLTAHLGSNLSWLYSDLRWPAATLIAIAIPLGWVGHVPGLAARPRLQSAIRLGAIAIALLAALAWTLLYGQPAAAGNNGGSGGFSY